MLRSPDVMRAIVKAWRPSLFAGFMGATASQFWFLAFALATAASVRTVALVEVLFAQAISSFVFGHKTTAREGLGIVLIVDGRGAADLDALSCTCGERGRHAKPPPFPERGLCGNQFRFDATALPPSVTGASPENPSARAAAGERSMTRPRTNGPRSVMRTVTERPLLLLVTRTWLPNGGSGERRSARRGSCVRRLRSACRRIRRRSHKPRRCRTRLERRLREERQTANANA